MDEFIFPSSQDRAENSELDRICKALEALMDERERLGDALWNLVGLIDTPIGRRKLGLSHGDESLSEARKALGPYRAKQLQQNDATHEKTSGSHREAQVELMDIILQCRAMGFFVPLQDSGSDHRALCHKVDKLFSSRENTLRGA